MMRRFISRILFPIRRGSPFTLKRLLMTKQIGTYISEGYIFTSKPALLRCHSSLKGHEHLITRQNCGSATASANIDSSNNQETVDIDIEIISKEEIKPASPTPHHLRTYTLSSLDQISPDCYTSLLFFFSPNNWNNMLNDVTSERRQRLKESLSKILVPFYPVAGNIKDNLHIECNDDGVYYVEVQTNMQLSHLLRKPENDLINRLCPFHPDSVEILSRSYVLMVQISTFNCGGIVIGLNASHKIFDGLSVSTFMQAWASTARESSKRIDPSFISSSIFPPIPNLFEESSLVVSKPHIYKPNYTTKRFVFDSLALAALKSKASSSSFASPSLVTAVISLLWKSVMAASKARNGVMKESTMYIPVNVRPKISPPLPPHSLGNIIWLPRAQSVEDSNLELKSLVDKIRNAIATINPDFIECIQGGDEIHKFTRACKEFEKMYNDPNSKAEYIQISSICKTGFYEVDFGWGKPIWSCVTRGNKDLHRLGNIIHLIETKSGDGIEACVTIREEDMAILQQNPKLLGYASLNPSRLES